MQHSYYKMDLSDVTTSFLSTTTVLAILGSFAGMVGLADMSLGQILLNYSEWYTQGVGAIVVTVNGYLLWRKIKRIRNNKRNDDEQRN